MHEKLKERHFLSWHLKLAENFRFSDFFSRQSHRFLDIFGRPTSDSSLKVGKCWVNLFNVYLPLLRFELSRSCLRYGILRVIGFRVTYYAITPPRCVFSYFAWKLASSENKLWEIKLALQFFLAFLCFSCWKTTEDDGREELINLFIKFNNIFSSVFEPSLLKLERREKFCVIAETWLFIIIEVSLVTYI